MHAAPITTSWPVDVDAGRLDADRGALVVAGDGPTCVVLLIAAPASAASPPGARAIAVALAARDLLAAEGVEASVVAIVDPVAFARQDSSYRDQVLPPAVPRVDMAGLTPQAGAVDARRQLRRRR